MPDTHGMKTGTFSIVARDRKSGEFGVATATAAPCVGAFLPHAIADVGAIATQAWVNVNLGYQGLELMRSGLGVGTALEALLSEDPGREKRQLIGIDGQSVFGHTGKECTEAKGHILGDDFAVAGNILADKKVLERMAEDFKRSKGELAPRILQAVEAGQQAGGDHRGKMSAALRVASRKPKLYHDIRVDYHPDPVKQLRTIFDKLERLQEEYGEDDDGEVLKPRITRVLR